jgi:hypothetical protein
MLTFLDRWPSGSSLAGCNEAAKHIRHFFFRLIVRLNPLENEKRHLLLIALGAKTHFLDRFRKPQIGGLSPIRRYNPSLSVQKRAVQDQPHQGCTSVKGSAAA